MDQLAGITNPFLVVAGGHGHMLLCGEGAAMGGTARAQCGWCAAAARRADTVQLRG